MYTGAHNVQWFRIIDYGTVNVLCRWFIPFIGHMGICTMQGVIRDFAGPYFVSVSRVCFVLKCYCLTQNLIFVQHDMIR